MILFLTGPEAYLLRQKVAEIVAKAEKSGTGESGIVRIDGGEAKLGEVRTALSAGDLFSTGKRLVIVRDWLASHSAAENEEFVELVEETPDETIVVVAESAAPDKRQAATKKLTKKADKHWSFEAFDPGAAARWLTTEAPKRDAKLSPALARQMVEAVGTDLWTLSNELDKLTAAAKGKPAITDKMVEMLVVAETEGNVWTMVDALSKGDSASAVKEFTRLTDDGEPPLKTFGMIVRQYRILLGMKSLAGSSPDAAAKQLGIHPFAAKQAARFTERFTEEDLKQVFDELAELDFQMKTGRREPEAALELFLTERAAR
jgi:DNA polymerase-3 subunit delta